MATQEPQPPLGIEPPGVACPVPDRPALAQLVGGVLRRVEVALVDVGPGHQHLVIDQPQADLRHRAAHQKAGAGRHRLPVPGRDLGGVDLGDGLGLGRAIDRHHPGPLGHPAQHVGKDRPAAGEDGGEPLGPVRPCQPLHQRGRQERARRAAGPDAARQRRPRHSVLCRQRPVRQDGGAALGQRHQHEDRKGSQVAFVVIASQQGRHGGLLGRKEPVAALDALGRAGGPAGEGQKRGVIGTYTDRHGGAGGPGGHQPRRPERGQQLQPAIPARGAKPARAGRPDRVTQPLQAQRRFGKDRDAARLPQTRERGVKVGAHGHGDQHPVTGRKAAPLQVGREALPPRPEVAEAHLGPVRGHQRDPVGMAAADLGEAVQQAHNRRPNSA